MTPSFALPKERFEDNAYIEARVALVPRAARGSLRTALRYLYLSAGPTNLKPDPFKKALPHVEPAEEVALRWLRTRTNGSLRASYGKSALHAARAAKLRCETCDFDDVRALNLDHVQGRVVGTPFACLCANCHTIKSRASDWSGAARQPAPAAPVPTTSLELAQAPPSQAAAAESAP